MSYDYSNMCSASSLYIAPSSGSLTVDFHDWTLSQDVITTSGERYVSAKEKHFCEHCGTNSENTNSRGNCIACGAPLPDNHIIKRYSDRMCGWKI